MRSARNDDCVLRCQVNLAYRWFCKLSIEDNIPDHSVFCRARHERFRESEALRRVFEDVVAKCIGAGLVGGEALSVDASLIKADVDKKKRMPGDQPIAWPKAEEASRALAQLPQGKLAFASAPSASSAALLEAPAGVGASQVDSCRRKRDMPDLRAVVLSRLRIHYR